jgi:hypothetical protein
MPFRDKRPDVLLVLPLVRPLLMLMVQPVQIRL